MKKYIPSYAVFLLLFFVASCEGQKKIDQPQKTKVQPKEQKVSKQPETISADHDPYFQESKNITSPYGPNSITRTILEDSNGYIWLATWEGIIRYDGNFLPISEPSFINFTNKEGLRRYHVFTIFEDRTGNIWFGTIGAGVYRYNPLVEKTFTNFTTKDGLPSNSVTCIYEDKAGNIWFGTGGGASRYNGKIFQNFTEKEGMMNHDINSIIEDKTGKFWFGTRGIAFTYDGKTFTQITNKEGRPFTNVRSIIEDKNGKIWLGGNDGLWNYDGSTFTNFTHKFVGRIFEDKKGNIWTSSEGANPRTWVLSRFDEKDLQDGSALATPIKTEQNMFFGITEDSKGNIWLGSLKGVYRYDGKFFTDFKGEEAKD